MDLKLKGKVALVTGAARDVGREIALTLAAEGATVAVNYATSAAEAGEVVAKIKAGGGTAKAYGADVSDYAAVKAMVATIADELGGLNVLVNNAGLALRRRFVETNPQDWRRQIDVCLYGAIHCCHAAAPHLEAGRNGRIIGVVGDSSRVGESGLSIVAAARAGVIGLMKSLARELAKSGTTANVLALGLIETAHDPGFIAANREQLTKFYPLGRLGRADDVPATVALLASDHASWITGQVISVSGGYSMVG